MLDIASLADFHQRLKEFENGHALDLSSSEDLSIAVMNLISIEEHLFFTANKTANHNYLHLLASVRQIRKTAQKALVKETVGEDWCTCKHLLAASMRLKVSACWVTSRVVGASIATCLPFAMVLKAARMAISVLP